MVEVRRDESANGVRLLIRDLATGNHIYLDPLELEALTRMDHSFFIPLVAPATREKTPTGVDATVAELSITATMQAD